MIFFILARIIDGVFLIVFKEKNFDQAEDMQGNKK